MLHNGAAFSYRNPFRPAHTETHLPSLKVTGHPAKADTQLSAQHRHHADDRLDDKVSLQYFKSNWLCSARGLFKDFYK